MRDYIDDEGTHCGTCGVIIQGGMWPFCPHESAESVMITRDEIPGGITLENYGPRPVTFYSHTERRAYMATQGLVEKEKFCPMPGTDVDPQGIPNPAGYMDAQTMENGRILMSRNGRSSAPEMAPDSTVHIGLLEVTQRDLHAVEQNDSHRMARIGRRIDDARQKSLDA